MRDDNSKGSDYDLDKILEEYSSVGKERRTSDFSQPAPEKKKFVLHIDESLIDAQDTPISKAQNSNGSGIYFSNYQKSGSKKSADSSNTVEKADKTEKKDKTSTSSKKRKSKIERVGGKAAVGFLSFILAGTVLLSYIGLTCIGDMLAINRKSETIEVTIPENATYEEIIDILKDSKLIKRSYFCKFFAKYRDFDEGEYLSGIYNLSSDMGLEGMLMDIMEEPVAATTIQLSFPEGWTVQQIFEKIENNDVCNSKNLYSAVRSSYSYDFYSEIAENDKRYLKLEGYFFPDTYDFYVGANTNYVINKFLENFNSKWTAEYQAKADKLGLTCDEVITIASIIQKEAANVEQMKTISSIIHNRLNNPADFPTLGCDSTKNYIEKYVTPIVGSQMGNFYYENYRTDSNPGLPPGPICNPGMDAIRAALYPDDTNYYFFAHDDKGKIYLAKTNKEHERNLWDIEQANKGN